METTLIYSVPFGCSFAAIAALEWSGLPFQLARVEARDPASKQHPAFLAINPLSQTPALLTHTGAPLLESMAILLHLAARAPASGLGFAQGTPACDRLNSVLSFLHTTFHAAFMPAFQAARAADNDA
ncbi:MAG: glutathione S-transferase N-terminal domain-containing protein, partial [Janthinobacterium sp.]